MDKFMQDTCDDIKNLLAQIESKYQKHKNYDEYLKWDLEPAKENLLDSYHLRRIGYHLCTEFDDKEMAENVFEHAVNVAAYNEDGGVKDDKEELIDVLNDMTFLDEEAAKSQADLFDVEL